jgi:hypothetical protein
VSFPGRFGGGTTGGWTIKVWCELAPSSFSVNDSSSFRYDLVTAGRTDGPKTARSSGVDLSQLANTSSAISVGKKAAPHSKPN